jgi:hypothetical protein
MRTINLISCVLLTLGLEANAGDTFPSDTGADSADMQQDNTTAFQTLKNAEALESAYIGFAAMPSENLKSLREIMSSSEAESTLVLLYEQGNLTAKLYAIIGLQLLEQEDAARKLIQDARQFHGTTVRTMDGCVIFERPFDDLLQEVEEGRYAQLFAGTGS